MFPESGSGFWLWGFAFRAYGLGTCALGHYGIWIYEFFGVVGSLGFRVYRGLEILGSCGA